MSVDMPARAVKINVKGPGQNSVISGIAAAGIFSTIDLTDSTE
jgi:hypothetical protein